MDSRSDRRRRLPEALPPLRGWAWWLFLTVWLAGFAFAIVGSALFLRDDLRLTSPPEYRLGFATGRFFSSGIPGDDAVVRHVLSEEARVAGLKPDDRVLTINGRPVGGGDLAVRALLGALGEPGRVELETVSPDGRHTVLQLTSSDTHVEEGYGRSGIGYRTWRIVRTAWHFQLVVVGLGLAALLLARRARDPLAPWVSFSLMLSAISGPPSQSSTMANFLPYVFWQSTWAMDEFALLATLALFPDARFRPRWVWLVLLCSAGFALVVNFVPTRTDTLNLLMALVQIPAVAAVWARYRAMPSGPGRQQIRWALFGFGLSAITAFLTGLVRSLGFSADPAAYVWLDITSLIIVVFSRLAGSVAMTVGLMRYRLYDADATISRSVAYGAVTIALLGIFAGSEKLIEILGEEYFGNTLGALAGGLGAAIAAICVVPLHHRITHWAEKRFRSGLVHLRQGLPLLVGDLRETAPATALADAALVRVERGVRARHAAIVLGEEVLDARDIDPAAVAGWLARGAAPTDNLDRLHVDRRDPLFPLRVPLHAEAVGLVGWLLLGPRPDGSFYGRDEREALREIADPLARALAIAIERERREAARRDEVDDLRRNFDSLRRFVAERLGDEHSMARTLRHPG